MNFNDITFFKTAQGSKYIRLPDGRLRRWKSSHANTGGEDMGLHGWSTQSIFVDPKFEHAANSIQYLVGKGYKVALSKDAEGKMFPMIVDNGQWRPATWGDAYTVYARRNPDIANKVLSWKYSKEPVVGYHVVDFDLKGGGRGTEIKGYHFGSPVSEIGSLSDEDKKLFFPSQSNLQESIKRVLKEEYKREYILYRAVGLDEAIKSCEVGHLVYYSRDPMSRDWEVIEYGLGDAASEMSEDEVDEYVNNLVPWVPNHKGVNLTSDLDNAKGYSDIVLEINLVGYNYAEFSDVHIFAKNPDDCEIKSVYYNGKEYSKEEFLDISKSLQESIKRVLKELYSPEGRTVKPKKIVIHKSEKKNRKSIEQNGLIPKTGFCYKNYVGGNTLGKVRCRPAVFATNSTDPKQWFAKRWDGDVWGIDTSLIPDVVWYEDTHWFPDGQNKHIVTFDKIPPHALTLIQKGTE